jgi:hypothetical protein
MSLGFPKWSRRENFYHALLTYHHVCHWGLI